MWWFVLTGFAGLILVGAALATTDAEMRFGAITTIAIVALAWLGFTAVRTFHSIPAGHVGVVYTFGDVTGQIGSGFQATWPWQTVREASTQVQRERFDRIEAFSEETQDVFLTLTLNYEVSPDQIVDLYKNVGPTWFDKLVESRVLQITKDESVKYRTVNIAPAREEIRRNVRERLRAELAPYSINVVDLLIDNVDFRPEFKRAIERKQIATQDALREQQRVRQAKYEAQQKVERARGEARANRLIKLSLNDRVLQFEAIKKFGDDVEIILMPSGAGTLIDPSTFLETTRTGRRR